MHSYIHSWIDARLWHQVRSPVALLPLPHRVLQQWVLYIQLPERLLVVIVAKSRVWIDVKENKKVIFNQILSAGDAYFVQQSENDLIMRTGNASGLEVYINGVSKGLLSETETVQNNIILKPSFFER